MVTIIKKNNKIEKSNNYKALCLLFAGITGSSMAKQHKEEEQVVTDTPKKGADAGKGTPKKGADAGKDTPKKNENPGCKGDACEDAEKPEGCGWRPYLMGAGGMWVFSVIESGIRNACLEAGSGKGYWIDAILCGRIWELK